MNPPTDREEVSLAAFCAGLIRQVDRFAVMWRAGQSSEPEHYPAQMPDGEWYEQWLAFEESTPDE